jgi:hypothetical protein
VNGKICGVKNEQKLKINFKKNRTNVRKQCAEALSIFIFEIFHIFYQISDVKWNMLELSCGFKIIIDKIHMSAYKSFLTGTCTEY